MPDLEAERLAGLTEDLAVRSRVLDDAALARFHRDGYVVVRGMLDEEESSLVLATAKADRRLAAHAMGWPDDAGGLSRITLWNEPGDDIYGMVARSERVVGSMSRLLGGEVYHYHSKLMLKEPAVGGAWLWHQDYGYWYQNGCLYPLLASVFIALDPATTANGCLRVLRGSHRIGRIEHQVIAGQLGADPERVAIAEARHECVAMEMQPGDAAFFHCNLLHCSGRNRSANPRWTLICCYNARANDPYKPSQHPSYTPLETVPDEMIRAYGHRASADDQVFMTVEDDVSDERASARTAARAVLD